MKKKAEKKKTEMSLEMMKKKDRLFCNKKWEFDSFVLVIVRRV